MTLIAQTISTQKENRKVYIHVHTHTLLWQLKQSQLPKKLMKD